MIRIINAIILLFFFIGCTSSDDTPIKTPYVIINDMNIIEGDDDNKILDFIISLRESSSEDVLLKFYTEDASAFQNLDYKKNESQITISAGKTNVSIPIEIISDIIKEGDEVFRIRFEPIGSIDFNQTEAQIVIKNNDADLPYGNEDYVTPSSYEGWKLVWEDEFDGNEINKNWWTHEIGSGSNGWGNNELEYYTDSEENSRVEDGNLIIEARDDSWNGHKFTSARMVTKGKKSFGFSRIDIRAKLPFGQGIWPALWMLGDNIDQAGWPACGEIDIMEMIGNEASTSHATVHFGTDFASHKYSGNSYQVSNEIFNDRFHVFSVVKEVNQMWFFVDDIMIFEFNTNDTQGMSYPFNQNYFLILNVAIGGDWPGDPDGTTQFPQQMIVDYIRVFEKD
ncbi:MAG: glycoside hydrolase family 16 protein [Bacteroidota bacterium]